MSRQLLLRCSTTYIHVGVVTLYPFRMNEKAGYGETAIRDPLYVFAVSDDLTATMTDEVIDLCV